jgi:hypothetical protein
VVGLCGRVMCYIDDVMTSSGDMWQRKLMLRGLLGTSAICVFFPSKVMNLRSTLISHGSFLKGPCGRAI